MRKRERERDDNKKTNYFTSKQCNYLTPLGQAGRDTRSTLIGCTVYLTLEFSFSEIGCFAKFSSIFGQLERNNMDLYL